jgi:hypothetical protein
MVRQYYDSNLFSAWQSVTEDDWERHEQELRAYVLVGSDGISELELHVNRHHDCPSVVSV